VLASQSLPGSPEHYRATRGVLAVEARGMTDLGDLGRSVRSARSNLDAKLPAPERLNVELAGSQPAQTASRLCGP